MNSQKDFYICMTVPSKLFCLVEFRFQNQTKNNWVQIKYLKMILHWLVFARIYFSERRTLGVFFFFAVIWFSELLVFLNFVGLIFRRGGINFTIEELLRLDKLQNIIAYMKTATAGLISAVTGWNQGDLNEKRCTWIFVRYFPTFMKYLVSAVSLIFIPKTLISN